MLWILFGGWDLCWGRCVRLWIVYLVVLSRLGRGFFLLLFVCDGWW